jgi:two-component system, cell cycle sensor histidine kinase and response regulator CckA
MPGVDTSEPVALIADPERASLLERVRESRRDLEEAQRIARVGSWTLDPATGTATWSPEMYRIFGLDPDAEAVALPDINLLYTAESVDAVTAAVRRALDAGESWSLDLELIGPDGAGRGWVASRGVVERGPDGSVAKIRGTMQDVTDQRRLEAQLRQAQRLEAIGQLAGGIAHDFNNLLTAIRGYADLARDGLEANAPARQDLDQVVQAADRAASLARQLLAFSRRQVLQPLVVDPAEIVLGIAPMLQRLLGEDIALVTHAPIGSGQMRVDPSQLEQVILNLAVNARDAMPDGGRLTIEIEPIDLDHADATSHADTAAGPYVALIVTDTGAGMDMPTKARIFEPFFSTREPGHGTGMGLATVYGIVRQSGGSIYVYSEPGLGSTFKILLPRADVAARTDEAPHLDGRRPA